MDFPERLTAGYRNFLTNRLPDEQSRFRELATRGQKPEVMVIGCCDSRVSPEVIFDAAPGELFVARNVANLVPPYSPDGATRAVRTSAVAASGCPEMSAASAVMAHGGAGRVVAVLVSEGDPISEGQPVATVAR